MDDREPHGRACHPQLVTRTSHCGRRSLAGFDLLTLVADAIVTPTLEKYM
jgi:hypothetical protein